MWKESIMVWVAVCVLPCENCSFTKRSETAISSRKENLVAGLWIWILKCKTCSSVFAKWCLGLKLCKVSKRMSIYTSIRPAWDWRTRLKRLIIYLKALMLAWRVQPIDKKCAGMSSEDSVTDRSWSQRASAKHICRIDSEPFWYQSHFKSVKLSC